MAAPLGTKVGSAFFEVVASFAGFGESLQSGVVNAITSRGLILGQAMESLGKQLFTKFTIPFGVAAAANVAQFQHLERAIAETLTLFGTAPVLIDETFDAMSKGISDVSREVGGLESQIADGLYQTISAGVPSGQAFEFIKVAQIAAIADKTSDLTSAVDGITTAISAYGLEFTDAEAVSDSFFATVARGKTTFGELSNSLGRVAPLAANAGVSLEETLSVIGQLTVQGLQTSEAVSFLRAGITGLLRPTDELNEIFARTGFATAEAAIPVIGLQKAFQTVVDAAGGSTSKLQELIGTSEGVTAILGVTGENTEKFASILNSVEDSAGRSSAAFAIVDQTVSRSFGRMTEAFDRLGNLFGSIGADFAQPVVDAITSILNELFDIFESLAPLIVSVSGAFAKFFKVFNLPVVKQMAALLAALVISFGGLLGILGAIVGPLGFVITKLISLGIATSVFQKTLPLFARLGKATTALGDGFLRLAERFTGVSSASKSASKSLTFFGKTLKFSTRQLIGFSAGMLAITAASVAALAIAKEWRESLEKIDRQTLLTTQGVDRLAESLGATLDPLESIAKAAEGDGDINFAFKLANADLLQSVQSTLLTLGQAAAETQVINIAYQISSRGGTTEDVEKFIDRVNEVAGLDIDLVDVINDINSGSAAFGGITVQLDKAIDSLDGVKQGYESLQGQAGSLIPSVRRVQNHFTELADQLVQLRLTEGPEAFKAAMDEVGEALAGTEQEDFFVDELLKSFDRAADGAADFSTFSASSMDDFWVQFAAGLPFISDLVGGLEEVEGAADGTGDALVDMTGGLPSDIEKFGIAYVEHLPGIIELTETQIGTLQDLKGEIDTILDAGTQYITDHFNEMNTQITNQMPLLGIYEGAIDQSFAKWKKGQEQFVEDLAAVDVARQKLVDNFEEGSGLVDAFDAQSLDKQAWLAALNPAEFQEAMDLLLASETAVGESLATRMEQDQNEIMTGVQNAMNARYQELYDEAAEAGAGVATLWQIWFDRKSDAWVTTAETVMADVARIISQDIPGPTVGPLNFGPTPSNGVYGQESSTGSQTPIVNLTVNNPQVGNLTGDTQKAVGIVKTSQLLRHT